MLCGLFGSSPEEDTLLSKASLTSKIFIALKAPERKIGDINEALRICEQSTQTASVYLNAFRNDLIDSEMISFKDFI